ncbi:MAG TPA: class I SAM-dependent methyltransferase [Stellaceae bacterium]|nr:class I SAM-dependent methyltransferase [Stellaceae bacterium]
MSDSPTPHASGWVKYYAATEGRPPRPTLLFALDRFAAEGVRGTAADLGCGDGRDAIELLRRGWRVIGIDSEPVALERLATRPDLPPGALLDVRGERFEDAEWGQVELVNSSFALPFCPPPAFPALWRKIDESILSGGRFAAQLCGPRDSWAERGMDNRPVTFHDEAAARALFANYAIELFEIEETDSVTPRGETKHWHLFHVVAKKR